MCVCVLYIINNTFYDFCVLSLFKTQHHFPWFCCVVILQHWELNPGPPTFQTINLALSYIPALSLVFILISVLTKFPRMALNSLSTFQVYFELAILLLWPPQSLRQQAWVVNSALHPVLCTTVLQKRFPRSI